MLLRSKALEGQLQMRPPLATGQVLLPELEPSAEERRMLPPLTPTVAQRRKQPLQLGLRMGMQAGARQMQPQRTQPVQSLRRAVHSRRPLPPTRLLVERKALLRAWREALQLAERQR